MRRRIDLTGERFGRLTVIQYSHNQKGMAMWSCQCDCGNVVTTRGKDLRRGFTKSCGCLSRDMVRERSLKHGMYGTRLRRIWGDMRTRCYNQNFPFYHYYGGRGITICQEWQIDFQAFYNWAMDNGYEDSLTIDRIDNNKGYSPDNCRWVTMAEQNKNKRALNGFKIKEK